MRRSRLRPVRVLMKRSSDKTRLQSSGVFRKAKRTSMNRTPAQPGDAMPVLLYRVPCAAPQSILPSTAQARRCGFDAQLLTFWVCLLRRPLANGKRSSEPQRAEAYRTSGQPHRTRANSNVCSGCSWVNRSCPNSKCTIRCPEDWGEGKVRAAMLTRL